MKTSTFGSYPTNTVRSAKPSDFFDRKNRSPPKTTSTLNVHSRSPIFINESNLNIDPNDIKQMRDMRFQSLQETIKGVYHQILEDELLSAMKEDSSSTDFVNQRVKEIFEEVIENDREIYIEKLMSQYTYMKTMYKQLEEDLRKTSRELESIKDDSITKTDHISTEKREFQKTIESLEDENKRLQNKIQSFSNNFNDSMKKKDVDLQRTLEAKLDYENKIEHIQKQLKDQTVTLKSLKSELDSEKNKQKEFQHENELMKSKLSMLEEQNKKIMRINDEFSEKEQFYKAKIETINEENRELSKKFEGFKEEKLIIENECQNKLARLEEASKVNEESFQEFMEARKLKSKQKLESYKSKLIEYKQINANLQNTVEDLERALNQEKQHNQEYYEQINNEFREKEEVTNEKIKEMENFYQEKFNEQIKQIESEIGDSYAKTLGKLKGEKKVLKQQYEAKVSELEKTTIDKKTFEELLSKKDRIIEDLTNKLISYDKDQEIKLQKTLEVMEAKKAGEYDQKLKPYYQNLESLEFSLNEEKKKSKSLNLELQELKASYQEVLNRCNDLEKDLEEKQQKNEELSNEFKQLSDSKEKLEEAFQEKEAFFSRNQENFERASIENNFLSKSLEEKDLLMKNQYKELEKLQKSNVLLMEKAEKLQNDLFVSQKNFSDFENSSKENLRMMKQNLEMITTENKNLNIRLTQQQKDNMEKYEEEKKTTSNLKKELYVFELKLSEKEEKIQGLEKLLEKNEEIIKEIDNKYKNVSHALSKSEVILSNKENEKNKVLNQMKTMKKKFMNILREKFGDLKGNMRRLKMNCETVIEEYQGLMNQQISYLPNQIFIYKRQQITLMEDEIEKLKCDMKMRFNRDISSLQEKKENSENEIKRKYESQFEDWNRKSMELTRKMEEIQNNSKKMQGELYSLLKEKETYVKEIELLKGELEKSMSFNQKISKDKAELQSHQDNIVNERVAEIQLKTAKKEKKYLKAMKSLKKEVEILQDRNIKYLNEINEGIETLKLRFEAESRAISKASNEKISNLKEKLSDYESLISDFRGKSSNYELIISDLERNINEVNEDKDQIISRYENHIFMMTRTLDELSSNLRQEKDKHMKELMDKNLEIDILKNKSNRLEGETKRKEEELYSIKSEKNKINHQYEEALIKYNLKNSQCEKEVFEQVQEKKKYEEEVESLQNLLTKKYHKINQIRKNDEGVSINLNEKVRKLHDLEEELKYSLRTKTVVSPERTKISTPLIRNKNATNKQYYSTLTTKKNLTTEGKK